MITSIDLITRRKILITVQAKPDISVMQLVDKFNLRPTTIRAFLREHNLNQSDEFYAYQPSNEKPGKVVKKRHGDYHFTEWDVNEVKEFALTAKVITVQSYVYNRLKEIGIAPKLKWTIKEGLLKAKRVR